MPTIKQLIRNTRKPIINLTKSPALVESPQRRGTCTKVYVRLVQITESGKIEINFLI
nr:ribosomal protein S12 [Arceuthobium abietinum subsp. mathiasenii]UPU96217.1 ribosomal protein S12 [Arceuthobium abietinum subsp. magnificae]UPU96248.1 ribosomal protein S12 [Arceuthobium abietinum subsp. wiensii]UPU96279.1 ribosomal protein S12 [Arceuthobium apachecum]UPU96403.1 ribosomal protein S12 [Arceuthobium californicum]UPU96465.1 ribosomal protein S12 [Arceuthobium campylopodum]UPU96524.1 ribosomal protein S12 [Arceuthobium cyanocarpum]UPU96586.1 ribosomal protein S12 [Arceuthobiu